MKIFGKKKAEVSECSCGCGCGSTSTQTITNEAGVAVPMITSIKVLGSGCAKCNQLEAETVKAIAMLNLDVEVEHITDFVEIASYGVMSTPALVVNNKVMVMGKVVPAEDLVIILQNA